MDIKSTVLLVTALLNLGLGLFVFFRDQRNRITISFSLLMFSIFLWQFALFSARLDLLNSTIVIFHNLTYIFSAIIGVLLLYFSYIFPYSRSKPNIISKFYVLIGLIITITLVSSPYYVVTINRITDYNQYINNKLFHYIFAIYFVSVVTWAIGNLIIKYKRSEGIHRVVLRGMIVTLIIGGAFGSFFDLFLCLFFDNYAYNWLGPVFTLFMSFIVANLIFIRPKIIE